jgi:hypothetical protein
MGRGRIILCRRGIFSTAIERRITVADLMAGGPRIDSAPFDRWQRLKAVPHSSRPYRDEWAKNKDVPGERLLLEHGLHLRAQAIEVG